MDHNTVTILDKVRTLLAPLSAEERLAVVQAIADAQHAKKPSKRDTSKHHRSLEDEQRSWYAQEPKVRQRYAGEYVAVKDGQVVDQDLDQRSLYLRVRERFGHSPVLIVHADWTEPPLYTIHSPHLE